MQFKRTFERSNAVILFVQSQGLFEEAQREIILADSVQNEADVGVEQGHFRVILANDDER